MNFTPHWTQGPTGWYPIVNDRKARCLYCKEPLSKRLGLNRDGNGGYYRDRQGNYYVMAGFFFGAGPYCLRCATKEAWCNKDFFQQSGNSEYHVSRYDVGRTLRPSFPSIEEELKKL